MTRGVRGQGRVYLRGGVWWIAYSHEGKRRRESSGSAKRPVAVALLQKRKEEARQGRPHDLAEAVTIADLRRIHEADFAVQQRRSGRRLRQLWAHVVAHFGETKPAVRIKASSLDGYVSARLEAGAARATVKNELNALRRAFRLAQRSGTVLANEVPVFPTLRASDARKGFFEREDHERLRAALPPDAGDLAEFLFWSGWRVGEAKGLRWSDVDEGAGVLRIEDTKSGEPRTLPYAALPALAELIAHRRAVTEAVQRRRGVIVPEVFHRGGKPIRYFRRAWAAACVTAGLGQEVRDEAGRLVHRVAHRTPHDYRRSAARNLSRAGVPEGVIMRLCGWKTRTVFDRYRIVAERDLAEGLARLGAAPAPRSKVARMRKGTVGAQRRAR